MNTIRQHREALGWTIRDLAKNIGSDISSISHWENQIKIPRPTKRRKLAEVFGSSIEELFPDLREKKLYSSLKSLPKWFYDAWRKRSVVKLVGWFDVRKLTDTLGPDQKNSVVVKDYVIDNIPLDLVVVPVNASEGCPALFENIDGQFEETKLFKEFENCMEVILGQKGILRNTVLFMYHKEGVLIHPQYGKERNFQEISKKLMKGIKNYPIKTIDLEM